MDIAQLPIAVITVDSNQLITNANPAALDLVEYDTGLIGQPLATLRPRRSTGEDVDVDALEAASEDDSTQLAEQDLVVLRSSGDEIEVIIDGGVGRNDDGSLKDATLVLRPKYRGARRPGAGTRIVSAVSHELRSPLTSIRGYTALLLKQWDIVGDDDRLAMLGQIDRDARRVTRLINELLDISRIESGRVQLNRVDLDLVSLAKSVIEAVIMSYPELEATVEFDPAVPNVWADPDKVTQVLTNLVENACKYASPKGVVIRGSVADETVKIEVIDKGPGIPPEDIPHLFQQFFHSKIGRPSGTGLGLWISRGLIEAHGGTLTAASNGTDGTTFAFTLPATAFEDLHGRVDVFDH